MQRAQRILLVSGLAVGLTACGAATSQEWPSDVPAATAPQPSLDPGQPLPDLEVAWFDGSTSALADRAGTPLVVNFWASWCAPCIDEMPDLEQVHRLADGDVVVIGVNMQDRPERAAKLVDETGVTYDLIRDPDAELSRAFGVRGLPATFYVDADGRIVHGHTGVLTFDAVREDVHAFLGIDLPAGN